MSKREAKTGEKFTHQIIANVSGVERVSVTLWEQDKRHPGFLNILNYCPLHLLIEVSGEPRDDKAAKVDTIRKLWVPAVNNCGQFGRWDYIEDQRPVSGDE
jgi:hypothetical protein